MRIGKLLLCVMLGVLAGTPAFSQRSVTNIDFDWFFHLGEISGAENDTTDYSAWRKLDIPHDWSIEQSFDEANKAANAFLPGGIGWYKKELFWSDSWNDKLVFIDFDGVYMKSTVWINGHQIGYRPNGYLSLFYELTPYLRKGRNIITVKVDNSLQPSARWYAGSGIYRHVNIVVTDKIRVAKDGTYVTTPIVKDNGAAVDYEVEIDNRLAKSYSRITLLVLDQRGHEVARAAEYVMLDSGRNIFKGRVWVDDPDKWSPDNPALYVLRTIIECDGRRYEEYDTRFGIRKLDFDPRTGFYLNGISTKMKGVCLHQNTGPFGIAVPDDMWRKRLAMLKEMGCNAIRTSHYPYSPFFYDLCDEMGFMVMDEPWDGWAQWTRNGKAKYDYSHYFLDWWQKDLADFIKRDRNHPSVVIWCMGNEVWRYENHIYWQKLINDTFHDLDPTRPTTQAWAVREYLDIAGFNANGEGRFDLANFRARSPEMLAVGTEIPHTRQTRSVYRTKTSYMPWDKPDLSGQETGATDLTKLYPIPDLTEEEVFKGVDLRYASGYDNQTRKISCRDQWKQVRDNDFMIGQFIWTAFDYLGESWGWPARTNNFGIIDMADFPKDHYFLYQSMWSDKPMVHILPHWTHPGKEGVEIPVVAYTNGDEVELFLGKKSLGRKPMDKDVLQIVWNVPYEPGTLTAVAYKDGVRIATKSVTTAGAPFRIALNADRNTANANRRDVIYLSVDILDKDGNLVPNADNQVTFDVDGPCRLLGVENGDILDMSPAKSNRSNAFMGKTLLVLQTTEQTGKIKLVAKSEGLRSASETIDVLQ